MLGECPECGSLPRAFWREIYRREVQPDESVHNIPVQEYSVYCGNLLCDVGVSAVYGHRTPHIERLMITAWNNLPKTFLESK